MMRMRRCPRCKGEGFLGRPGSHAQSFCPRCQGSGDVAAVEHETIRSCANCESPVRDLPEPAEVTWCDSCQQAEPETVELPCNCGSCADSLDAADVAAARGLRLAPKEIG